MRSGAGDGEVGGVQAAAPGVFLVADAPTAPVAAPVGLVSGFHASGQIQLVKQPNHREASVALAIGRWHPLRIPSDAFGQPDGADIALVPVFLQGQQDGLFQAGGGSAAYGQGIGHLRFPLPATSVTKFYAACRSRSAS